MQTPLIVFGDETCLPSSYNWLVQFATKNGYSLESYATEGASVFDLKNNLRKQIDKFNSKDTSGRPIDILVSIGNNDAFDGAQPSPAVVAGAIETAIEGLIKRHHVRNFIVCTQFDTSRTPLIWESIQGSQISNSQLNWLSFYSSMLPIALRKVSERLNIHEGKTKITLVDLHNLYDQVLDQPELYGMANSLAIQSHASNIDDGLFFGLDNLPNARAQSIVASFVQRSVNKSTEQANDLSNGDSESE